MSANTFENILAIDTATRKLLLALAYGGDRLVRSTEQVEKSHGQVIVKKTDELFESSGLAPEALQAVVVSLGPGSFTGLRIGLAVAKGISVGLNVPVVGVSLFELAACKLGKLSSPRHLVIPSRRGELYLGSLKDGTIAESDIIVIPVADLQARVAGEPVHGIGLNPDDLFEGVMPGSEGGELEYDAGDLLSLGREKLLKGEQADPSRLEPMYLQKSIAETRFERQRRQP